MAWFQDGRYFCVHKLFTSREGNRSSCLRFRLFSTILFLFILWWINFVSIFVVNLFMFMWFQFANGLNVNPSIKWIVFNYNFIVSPTFLFTIQLEKYFQRLKDPKLRVIIFLLSNQKKQFLENFINIFLRLRIPYQLF